MSNNPYPLRRIVASLGLVLLAQTSYGMDLLEAYRLAEQKDPAFQAEKDALQSSREILPQAKAAFLPRVSLSGQYNEHAGQRTSIERTTILGQTISIPVTRSYDQEAIDARVSVSQPIFRPASYFQYKQAKVQSRYGEVRFDNARIELIRRVSEHYFKALLAEENLRLAEAEGAALEAVSSQADKLFQKGLGTVTDKHEAEARLLRAKAALLKAQSDRSTAYRLLAATVGQSVEQVKKLRSDAGLPDLDSADANEWIRQGEVSSVKVVGKQLEFDFQKAELSKARSQHLPTLDLVASYNLNRDPGATYVRNDYRSIGVQLSIPLYAGGELNSRSRQRASDVNKAEHDLEAARNELSTEVNRLIGEIAAGKQEVSALKQAVDAAKVAVESNKRSQQGGVRTFVDVLNAERDLYSAQRELARAKFDYLLRTVELKAVAGRLTEQDLNSINQLLG